MERLRSAERERHAAIGELQRLAVVRSRVFVGDPGEQIAAAYSGVERAPVFTPRYDLTDRDGRRAQVKPLRATPDRPRHIMGSITCPCDVLLGIRLDFDDSPSEALEMPVVVAEGRAIDPMDKPLDSRATCFGFGTRSGHRAWRGAGPHAGRERETDRVRGRDEATIRMRRRQSARGGGSVAGGPLGRGAA